MLTQTLALAGLIVFWYMLALFIVSLVRRDNSIVDIAWGPGILAITLATLWWWQPAGLRPVLVTVLVAVWALRLAAHLFFRNQGRGEDWRYAQLRRKWTSHFWLHSLFQIFFLQGVLLIVVALPVLWVNTLGGPHLTWLDWLGFAVWLAGFAWEATADHQLSRFLQNPDNKGRVLSTGLWKYSRHPNYFGEIIQWWGIWLIALSVSQGWLTILGPLTITFLILKVSGVPLVEIRQRENPEFREYATRTNAVFPGLLKNK
jgi:steroid 5-alpha reductase family enzyme